MIRIPRPLHCERLSLSVLTRSFPRTFLVAAFRSPEVPSRSRSFALDKVTFLRPASCDPGIG